MSLPKGLIVRVKCFALCLSVCACVSVVFFSIVLFVFVYFGDEEQECCYHHVPSGNAQSPIDKQDAFHYFRSELCSPVLHSEDAGLSMTLTAAWRLLVDDRECLALLEVWLMGSMPVSGSLSTRRIAGGHCVCALASSAFLLYRNALIDISEDLINKGTHSLLSLMELALLVSFWPLMECAKDFVGERGGTEAFLKPWIDLIVS